MEARGVCNEKFLQMAGERDRSFISLSSCMAHFCTLSPVTYFVEGDSFCITTSIYWKDGNGSNSS
jgi:hypothetical protein